jgi:molecular chaperone HscB
MSIDLNASDFALFELPEQFRLDMAQLDRQWKALLREAHPDKFAGDGAAAQRVAMQWAVRINEAYQRLKNPQSRAAYLCERRGAPVKAHTNTAMPSAFLMQQMAWRESLEEATTPDDLETLLEEAASARKKLLDEIAIHLDGPASGDNARFDRQADGAVHGDVQRAAESVRALMFVERFSSEVGDALARMDN